MLSSYSNKMLIVLKTLLNNLLELFNIICFFWTKKECLFSMDIKELYDAFGRTALRRPAH